MGSYAVQLPRDLGNWSLSTVASGLAAALFARQIPSQSLKVDVDLVMINATVTADAGHYVTGLQKKDFHIWEDKVE